MATNNELRLVQAKHLFSLLEIQMRNPELKIKRLTENISRVKAEMTEPEIAWVEMQVRNSLESD